MERTQGQEEMRKWGALARARAIGLLTQNPTGPQQALVRASSLELVLLPLSLQVECVTPTEQSHQAPAPGQMTFPESHLHSCCWLDVDPGLQPSQLSFQSHGEPNMRQEGTPHFRWRT